MLATNMRYELEGNSDGRHTNTDRSRKTNTEYNYMYKNADDDKIGEEN